MSATEAGSSADVSARPPSEVPPRPAVARGSEDEAAEAKDAESTTSPDGGLAGMQDGSGGGRRLRRLDGASIRPRFRVDRNRVLVNPQLRAVPARSLPRPVDGSGAVAP